VLVAAGANVAGGASISAHAEPSSSAIFGGIADQLLNSMWSVASPQLSEGELPSLLGLLRI